MPKQKRTEVPYSQTLTRAQFFSDELKGHGLSEQHDSFKKWYCDKYPHHNGEPFWNGTFAFEGEPQTERTEDNFDYVVHTMRVQLAGFIDDYKYAQAKAKWFRANKEYQS